MILFNLTTLHLWGRVLAKYPQAQALAYTDDGYIKGKMSVVLQVLTEFKHVLKEDTGLDLNISKTSVLPKDISQEGVFEDAQSFITSTSALAAVTGDITRGSFVPEELLSLGYLSTSVLYRNL